MTDDFWKLTVSSLSGPWSSYKNGADPVTLFDTIAVPFEDRLCVKLISPGASNRWMFIGYSQGAMHWLDELRDKFESQLDKPHIPSWVEDAVANLDEQAWQKLLAQKMLPIKHQVSLSLSPLDSQTVATTQQLHLQKPLEQGDPYLLKTGDGTILKTLQHHEVMMYAYGHLDPLDNWFYAVGWTLPCENGGFMINWPSPLTDKIHQVQISFQQSIATGQWYVAGFGSRLCPGSVNGWQ